MQAAGPAPGQFLQGLRFECSCFRAPGWPRQLRPSFCWLAHSNNSIDFEPQAGWACSGPVVLGIAFRIPLFSIPRLAGPAPAYFPLNSPSEFFDFEIPAGWASSGLIFRNKSFRILLISSFRLGGPAPR